MDLSRTKGDNPFCIPIHLYHDKIYTYCITVQNPGAIRGRGLQITVNIRHEQVKNVVTGKAATCESVL